MPNFWKLVNDVIHDADILLLVLDSRFPELTRNREIEQKILRNKKQLLFVFNKCDLVSDAEMDSLKNNYKPCVFVSSTKKLGGMILFKKIMELSHGQKCSVGVLGFPNVGKSSVINLLKGRASASVSPHSGHTRGIQFVNAKNKIKLIDTPGVLQFKEKDILKGVIICSKNPNQLKEPDFFATELIAKYPNMFENYYGHKFNGDSQEFLEEVALMRKILSKGGVPDTKSFGRQLLHDWQKGRIHSFMLNKEQQTAN
jgi:ribosome biogenesis GTPase A